MKTFATISCILLNIFYISIANANNSTANRSKCVTTHPYILNEGISLCSSFDDISHLFPNVKKETFYKNYNRRTNKDLSKAVFYELLPAPKDISHIEYKILHDSVDYYLPIKVVAHSNKSHSKIILRKPSSNKMAYELINQTKVTGDFFDYNKYYNDLVQLNGKPDQIIRKDNEPRPTKLLKNIRRAYGRKYAKNNENWTYIDACWGSCMPTGNEDRIRFKCKQEDKCMLFEYSTVNLEEGRTHNINTTIYNPKSHPVKEVFWQKGKDENRSTRRYLRNK